MSEKSEADKIEALTAEVVEALEDKKADDVLVIDVRGRCAYADRFVIASGRNNRQLQAMAQALSGIAHRLGLPFSPEGREALEWMLVDLGDVVVHLFLPEIRQSFQLEQLWSQPGGAAPTPENKGEA